MNYTKMIKDAKAKGIATEGKMWESIASLGQSLDEISMSDPALYWSIMRAQHGIIYDCHYSEEFSRYDVERLHYTDADGREHTGGHWTLDEVTQATDSMTFPQGVNKYDRYVAMNVMYSDLCREFTDEQCLRAAYLFFFRDDDWSEEGSATKIWKYMSMRHE